VIVYVEFLKSRLGKGLYIILVGLLLYDSTRTGDMAISIIIVLVGIFNIIVSCMRDEEADDPMGDQLPKDGYFRSKQQD
jgi:hypothetical protein